MDMEGIMLSEINQTEKDIWYHLYVESKKYNKLGTKTKKSQTQRYGEETGGYQWRQGGGEMHGRGRGL